MVFLFYDNQWQIAELNYFQGGRILRNVNEDDIKGFQIYPITKNTDAIKTSICDLFRYELQNKNWRYSGRRYDFLKCIDYSKNSNIKRGKMGILLLELFGLRFLPKPQNAGWTCVETTFHILDKHQCNPFKTKLSPYELLVELNETHTKN